VYIIYGVLMIEIDANVDNPPHLQEQFLTRKSSGGHQA
jgi:hypothetical protein